MTSLVVVWFVFVVGAAVCGAVFGYSCGGLVGTLVEMMGSRDKTASFLGLVTLMFAWSFAFLRLLALFAETLAGK